MAQSRGPPYHSYAGEILEGILRECGVILIDEKSSKSEGVDHWDQFSLALFTLATAITRLAASEKPDSQTKLDPGRDRDSLILEVESAAQQVHGQCESFTTTVQNRFFELLMNIDKAKRIFPVNDLSRLHVVLTSLVSGIRTQLSLAKTIAQEALAYLPQLYSMVETRKTQHLAKQLISLGRLLQQRCISTESSPWREALQVCHGLQSAQRQERTLVESQQNISKSDVLDSIPSHEAADPSQGCQFVSTPSPKICETVWKFLDGHSPYSYSSKFMSILVVGAEGSGKSFLCDQIQSFARTQGCHVLRPQLPLELLGASVGETEDSTYALFGFAVSKQQHTIVLLDDAEHIFGDLHSLDRHSGGRIELRSREPHLQVRTRSAILSAMDALEGASNGGNKILLVCTSRLNFGPTIGRFDETHILSPPTSQERKQSILDIMESSNKFANGESWEISKCSDALSSVVDCSIGMHYGELIHHFRKSILLCCQESEDGRLGPENVLTQMKRQMQTTIPSSLRNYGTDDFVDLNIWTAKDMPGLLSCGQRTSTSAGQPLFGKSAEVAWQELNRLIIVPLCRSKELNALLYQGQTAKSFCSGILLTGPPGCGKSAISYASAIAASTLLPSVKLIDVSCTSLIHKEVGRSERSLHKLFECCRAAAPCILLMDGIENVAAVRGSDNTTEGTMDRVLSALLTELDGVDNHNVESQSSKGPIAIIGITSNVDWIDPALRRPGRLEKVVRLGLPEKEARYQIAFREIEQSPLLPKDETDCSFLIKSLCNFVSEQTEELTGAGVIALCNEAKLRCAREAASSEGSSKILALSHFVVDTSSSR